MGFITNSLQLSGDTYTSPIITKIYTGDTSLIDDDNALVTARIVKNYVETIIIESGGTSALVDLTDVNLTTPSDNDVLVYSSGNWINSSNYVRKTGTPVDNQVAVWTANGIIEGNSNLTFSGSQLNITGTVQLNGDLQMQSGHYLYLDDDGDGWSFLICDNSDTYGFGYNNLIIGTGGDSVYFYDTEQTQKSQVHALNYYADEYIDFTEISSIGTVPSGHGRLYVANDLGTTKLYFKDSGGTITDLLEGGGTSYWTQTGLNIHYDTGNVGIGTGVSAPTRELEVTGSGNVYIRITSPSATDWSALEFVNTNETWMIRNDDTLSDSLVFANDTSSVMTMNTSGEIGIGGTPTTNVKLHVHGGILGDVGGDTFFEANWNGAFKIGDVGALGDQAYIEGDSSTINVWASGAKTMVFDSSNRVGIKTTPSSYTLEVAGTIGTTGTNSITSGNHLIATGNVYSSNKYFVFGTSTGDGEYLYSDGTDIDFIAGGTTRATIDGTVGLIRTDSNVSGRIVGGQDGTNLNRWYKIGQWRTTSNYSNCGGTFEFMLTQSNASYMEKVSVDIFMGVNVLTGLNPTVDIIQRLSTSGDPSDNYEMDVAVVVTENTSSAVTFEVYIGNSSRGWINYYNSSIDGKGINGFVFTPYESEHTSLPAGTAYYMNTNKGIRIVDDKIGAGTSNPVTQLEVVKDQSAGTYIQVKNTDTSSSAGSGFKAIGESSKYFDIITIPSAYSSNGWTDSVLFRSTLTNGITIYTAGGLRVQNTAGTNAFIVDDGYTYIDGHRLQDSTDRSGLLEIYNSTASWQGIQLLHSTGQAWSLMGDTDNVGLYDDTNGEWILYYTENGAVSLYHDGTSKLTTSSGGVTVSGTLSATSISGSNTNWDAAYTHISSTGTDHSYINQSVTTSASPTFVTLNLTGNLDMADNDLIRLGTGDDFEIFHDGSNNYIDLNVGDLYIRDNTTNRFRLLRTTGQLDVQGDLVAYSASVSDERLKENVVNLDSALSKVLKLRGINFEWKEGYKDGTHVGYIAQEIEEIMPEVVVERNLMKYDDKTYKIVRYEEVIPYLSEAIKEQQKIIENMKQEKIDNDKKYNDSINELKKEIQSIKNKLK